MKHNFRLLLIWFFVFGTVASSSSQGLPPGWDYNATPSNHIISVPVTSQPNINGFLIEPGDYIGVFYTNDDGELACGGASEWLGDQNTGIIAYGDDSFTGDKDGFSSGEVLLYRYYSWSVQKEYDAEVICNDSLPVTCDIFIPNGLSGIDTTWAHGFYILGSTTPDMLCFGDTTHLLVQASGGSDNYTYSWTSEPPGFESSVANPEAWPVENTTYNVAVQDIDEILQTSVFVEVFPQPVANAGDNITICEDSTIVVYGDQDNGSGFFWSTAGDGSFDNINLLSPQYTPGSSDILSGGVELTFTVNAISPCESPAFSSMELSIIGLPVLQVGDDQTVCENDIVNASLTLLNGIELLWTTDGDGTFVDPTLIETQYSPGINDIQNGSVELTATAYALSPCAGNVSSSFVVEFAYQPIVVSGDDQFICESDEVSLIGSVSNTLSVLWESEGDGSFLDANEIQTIYSPGSQDISNGSVKIFLLGQANQPCVGYQEDSLLVSIVNNPEVSAGNDLTICESSNLQLNGSAIDYDEIFWTTLGDGTFSDPNNLNTIYQPGALDVLNQEVKVVLSAQPLFPCLIQKTDSLIVYIELLPAVNAGDNVTICEDVNLQLNGFAENFDGILWLTLGDGSFDDPNMLDAVYQPGELDMLNGEVELVLIAEPLLPCSLQKSDSIVAIIEGLPTANAGDDFIIPIDESYQLQGQAFNYSMLEWLSSGDGSFDNANVLEPFYTPGIGDNANASVNLTLQALPNSPCLLLSDDTMILTIDTIVGVNTLYENSNLRVFPNPSKGNVLIEFPMGNGPEIKMMLFDRSGKCVFDLSVFRAELDGNRQNFNFPIQPGIYLLQIDDGENTYHTKIIRIKE